MAKGPIVAVGAVIWRGPERVLLVRRGQPPRIGEWSIPGGRVEMGERLMEALAREVLEETGLTIATGELIDVVDFMERDADGAVDAHFVLIDFSARWTRGEPHAGSDVSECAWFLPAEAIARVSWEETRRIIRLSARQLWQLKL
ncbi:MAG: NUDIX hydrolase [Alphaproteobacteria bacterium]|nr:NUDIX hydrolase [Alphaproteobacteria bacterium]MBV9061862.1 NUDIX hydrolase [Alphaproteobacteria bacterium]